MIIPTYYFDALCGDIYRRFHENYVNNMATLKIERKKNARRKCDDIH